jgi:hypothetical protein
VHAKNLGAKAKKGTAFVRVIELALSSNLSNTTILSYSLSYFFFLFLSFSFFLFLSLSTSLFLLLSTSLSLLLSTFLSFTLYFFLSLPLSAV